MFTVHSAQHIVYNIQFTVFSVEYTVYSIQFTVHRLQYTVYIIQLIVYSLQYTVYSTQYRLLTAYLSLQFTEPAATHLDTVVRTREAAACTLLTICTCVQHTPSKLHVYSKYFLPSCLQYTIYSLQYTLHVYSLNIVQSKLYVCSIHYLCTVNTLYSLHYM